MPSPRPSPGRVRPVALLEREQELAEASALFDDVRAQRGWTLLIEAPAGLGKSTLIEEVRARARADGLLVLAAAGHILERGMGWGVARSLFEPWLLGLPGEDRRDLLAGPAASASLLLGPDGEPGHLPASEASFAILHGLYWLTARIAESQPTLLIVDDAQWADEPSLRLLVYMLGRIREQPIGVIAAMRTGEPDDTGLLAQLAGDRLAIVRELAPLSPGAVSTLIRDRMPAADDAFCMRCWELTAGNPLGVYELMSAIADLDTADSAIDAVAERAARSLSRSVLRRLGSLSSEAQALADAVAVFEGGAEPRWAAEVARLGPGSALAAADELSRADILAPGDPLSFTHPLLRAAVYGALSRRHRALIHRQAAAVLLGAHASAEQVAVHLLEVMPAGDPDVVHVLREAGRRAMAHGVPASAAGYLRRALQEPPPDADRAAVMAELGQAEASFAPRQAVEHLAAAMNLAREASMRARLALELGRALHDAGRPEEACGAFERGLAELGEQGGDLAMELEAWYLTSAVLLPERAHDAHRQAEAIVTGPRARSTPAARMLASKSLIMRVYEGRPHEPLAELARDLYCDGRLIEEGGLLSQASTHVAATLSYCDDYVAAETVLGRGRDEAQRIGFLTGVAACAQLRARQRLWTGPIPDAVADAATGVEIFSAGQQMYLPASAYCLARGLIEADDTEGADDVLTMVERDAPPTGIFAAWQYEGRGRLAAARGQWPVALEGFLACGQLANSVLVRNPALFHWRSEAGLAALRLDQLDLARELIDEESALARRFGAPRSIGVAIRAAALLERGAAAETGLCSAADLFAKCGAQVELASTLVELGSAIRRAGRPAEARRPLHEALRVAEASGALRAARLAREELQRAGGRAPARGHRASELTPSERRVAELAAQGRSNREIANELFVTVKAVEWHLRNSYRKLEIRGRNELVAALSERQ